MSDETETGMSIDEQAAGWLVRVNAPDVRDEDIDALTNWLDASPEHLAAYERAESVWAAPEVPYVAQEPEAQAPEAQVIAFSSRRPAKPTPQNRAWWIGGSIAASLAGLLALVVLSAAPKSIIYETRRGETRQIALSDGTQLHLNTDTRLSVVMSSKARLLTLEKGEVALTVVHDVDRPLILQAGPSLLRDVGTIFDVVRHDDATTVTVAEGAVAVLDKGLDGQTLATKQVLRAGDQAVIPDMGKLTTQTLTAAPKGFDWERGQAVYRNASLAYVVKDLNRYLDKPLVVDGAAAGLKLTAVIALDGEASVVKHLQDYLPVEATTTDTAIHLRLKP